jgi:hypothetical protein
MHKRSLGLGGEKRFGSYKKKINIVIGSPKIHITLQQSDFFNATIMYVKVQNPHESFKSHLKHGI